jgi:hypothetical protein
MLLNTYYNFWNQGCTIQMNFKHISHSHVMMVNFDNYSLITTLSPCNSIFPNQFLLTLCTISKSTSRWTTLMKITLPNSSLIHSYAHPKLQHYNKCNNLHLAILANFWILIFPPPPQFISGQLQLIPTLTYHKLSPFELFQILIFCNFQNMALFAHYCK